jgi:hypothetical protein
MSDVSESMYADLVCASASGNAFSVFASAPGSDEELGGAA